MRHLKFVVNCALVFSSVGAFAQDSARTVQYHSQDIVPIRAKVKYTTLIELPTTEKIMEAATGDKDFWIVDVVGNFCFVHPAKQGISSNLNLITDKGNIYSFTLQDISALSTTPDLKVIVEPADRSAIVAASGPPQFVPAAQLEQSRQQLAALQSHVEQAVDEYKSAYPTHVVRKLTSSADVRSRRRFRPRCFAQGRSCFSKRVFDCFVVSLERSRPCSSAMNTSTASAMVVAFGWGGFAGSEASSNERALRSACSQLRVFADCRTRFPSTYPSIHFGHRQRRYLSSSL
jgi:hypothetical protein